MRAKYHVNKVDIDNIDKVKWGALSSLRNATAVSFSHNAKFCAFALDQQHVSLWDVSSVLCAMTELQSKYFSKEYTCTQLFWSHKNSRLGCIFTSNLGVRASDGAPVEIGSEATNTNSSKVVVFHVRMVLLYKNLGMLQYYLCALCSALYVL